MKMIAGSLLLLLAAQVQALPTYIVGDQLTLYSSDFKVLNQFYKRENGVDVYAVTGYEAEFDTYGTVNLTRMNFDLSGEVAANWSSSNFAMDVELYCDNTLIGRDQYEGIRHQNVSYLVKPQILKPNHPIPGKCEKVKIRLLKLGSLSRKFYTRITDINLRLYLSSNFLG